MKKVISIALSIIFLSSSFTFADDTTDIDKILDNFDAQVEKAQRDWNIPGMAVAVVIDGKTVYKKSFGIRNVKTKAKVTNQTIFQIGSCTKAFTSALTAMLVTSGRLKWEDKVNKYLPKFKLYDLEVTDKLTIEDLMSQNSGLPPYSQHFMLLFGYSREFIIESMQYIKPTGGFREKYSYQNNTLLVMGEVIKKVTGQSWERNVYRYIFSPIGMKYSSTDYKSFLSSYNRASGHYYVGGKLEPTPDSLPYNEWPYTFAPAGGINSNIDDMSKWLEFLLNGATVNGIKLITDENFNKLFEPKVSTKKDEYYCLGWRQMNYGKEKIHWHAGATDTQGAYVSFIRDKKIGVVVLMNLPNGSMAEALSKQLFDAYLKNPKVDWNGRNMQRAIDRQRSRQQTISPTPPKSTISSPKDLEKYVGTYRNVMYGDVKVKIVNNNLQFSAGSFKTWITMRHKEGNAFNAVAIPGWRFKTPMFVFKAFRGTNIDGMLVENMTDGIDSTFWKVN